MKNINLKTLVAFLIGIGVAYLYLMDRDTVDNSTSDHDHNTNESYAANLEEAKRFMQLHEEENLESLIAMLSDDLQHEPPMYGSEVVGKDEFIEEVKAYQDGFQDMKFHTRYWLPGTDSLGNLNGSVRVYGNWTAVHTSSGKEIDVRTYHYFDFEGGLISATGDYFDATGMMMSLVDDDDGN